MYVVTLSVFHNLAIWLLYVNKPEPEPEPEYHMKAIPLANRYCFYACIMFSTCAFVRLSVRPSVRLSFRASVCPSVCSFVGYQLVNAVF